MLNCLILIVKNMLKNIKLYCSLVLCAVIFTSCIKDEGNHDYVDIVEVQFAGIEEEYSVPRFEDLKIAPNLVFSEEGADENRFSYRWLAFFTQGPPSNDNLTELATTKNLDIKLELYPGKYELYYFVKDSKTEVEWQYKTNLEVVNSTYEGWLLLNDVNGGSRLDMLSLLGGEYQSFHDVLNYVGSELTLEGTPGFVYSYSYDPNFYGVYVSTSGNGTTKLEPNTFSWEKTNNVSYEFLSSQPENLELDNLIGKSFENAFAVKDGDIYYYHRVRGTMFNIPVNNGYKASPMIATGTGFGSWSIIYDTTNKQFLRFYGGTGQAYPISGGALFSWTTGKELVYMTSSEYNSSGGAETFAILKDANDGKQYLAVFSATTFGQSYYGEITATDFDQATSYAVSPDYGYLFYAVGSKVYQYDFSLGTAKLMLDKGAEEISMIKFHDFWGNSKYEDLQRQLIVCSYNPSGTEGSNGTMELYSVPPVNGQIILETSYTGFGKIKSVSYRERY